MKTYNVYSTLTCDQVYTRDTKTENGMLVTVDSVEIKGGAGIVNDRLYSPLGTRNEVDEAQLETLEQNAIFQAHKKNGYITISEHKEDIDKVAEGMNQKDDSRPLTPESEIAESPELDEFEHGQEVKKGKKK